MKRLIFLLLAAVATAACTEAGPSPPLPQPATQVVSPTDTPGPAPATETPAVTALPSPTVIAVGVPIRGSGNDVWLIDRGQKRLIPDAETFEALGYTENDVASVSDALLAEYPTGDPLSTVLQGSGDEIYVMEAGRRRHIPDMDTFLALDYTLADVAHVSDELLATFPEGPAMAARGLAPTARVRVSALNVRSGPGTQYPVVGAVRSGDELDVTAQTPDGTWLEVRYLAENVAGWVSHQFVELSGEAEIPIARAIPTPPPVTPSPTPPTVVQVGATPTPPCTQVPIRGFGKVWDERPQARALVGCAYYATEEGMRYVAQRFEGGVMFWTDADYYENQGVVWVLFADDHAYVQIPDTWSDGQAEPTPLSPPEGRFEPRGRLGKAWREGAGVKNRLGWAVEPEQSGNGAWQEFDRGVMFWVVYRPGAENEERWIYVLARYYPYPPGGRRNDWAVFEDTWPG